MLITKTETLGFENYEVTARRPFWFLGFLLLWKRTVVLKGVMEADDNSGRLVTRLFNESGDPAYTNGIEDIYLDNTCRMLMLIPGMNRAFLEAGFRPKTVTTYELGLKIVNKDPSPVVVPSEQVRDANA